MAERESFAHLEVCPLCKRHARIALSNGDESIVFVSKQMGLYLAELAFDYGEMSRDEFTRVERQIVQCPLEERVMPLDLALSRKHFDEAEGLFVDMFDDKTICEDIANFNLVKFNSLERLKTFVTRTRIPIINPMGMLFLPGLNNRAKNGIIGKI